MLKYAPIKNYLGLLIAISTFILVGCYTDESSNTVIDTKKVIDTKPISYEMPEVNSKWIRITNFGNPFESNDTVEVTVIATEVFNSRPLILYSHHLTKEPNRKDTSVSELKKFQNNYWKRGEHHSKSKERPLDEDDREFYESLKIGQVSADTTDIAFQDDDRIVTHTILDTANGYVLVASDYRNYRLGFSDWKDTISYSAGLLHLTGYFGYPKYLK